MENVSVPTRWPFWNTPNDPESISRPSCFASLSFSLSLSIGRGAAQAPMHPASSIKIASSRKNDFTVILLFRNELKDFERYCRTLFCPKPAKYSQSPRKGRLDPCRRLRRLQSPDGKMAAVSHATARIQQDHPSGEAVF